MIQGYGRNKKYTVLRDALLGIKIITVTACATTKGQPTTTETVLPQISPPMEHQMTPVNQTENNSLSIVKTQYTEQQNQTAIQPQNDYTPRLQGIEQQITEIRQQNNATLEEMTQQKTTINNMNNTITSLEGQLAQISESVSTLTKNYNSINQRIDYAIQLAEAKNIKSEVQAQVQQPKYANSRTDNLSNSTMVLLGVAIVGAAAITLAGYLVYTFAIRHKPTYKVHDEDSRKISEPLAIAQANNTQEIEPAPVQIEEPAEAPSITPILEAPPAQILNAAPLQQSAPEVHSATIHPVQQQDTTTETTRVSRRNRRSKNAGLIDEIFGQ